MALSRAWAGLIVMQPGPIGHALVDFYLGTALTQQAPQPRGVSDAPNANIFDAARVTVNGMPKKISLTIPIPWIPSISSRRPRHTAETPFRANAVLRNA
jgi:hypothetical protein